MRYIAPIAALLTLTLTACSSAYQPSANSALFTRLSGYEEAPGPGGLIKVSYKGNSAMLMYQVATYALYRSAEIARREGAPYFGLYQTLPDALQGRRSSSVRPTTLDGIPHAEVHISLHAANAPGLLSTAEVLSRLGPEIAAAAR